MINVGRIRVKVRGFTLIELLVVVSIIMLMPQEEMIVGQARSRNRMVTLQMVLGKQLQR